MIKPAFFLIAPTLLVRTAFAQPPAAVQPALPRIVAPGPNAGVVMAPSDAVVLFDGTQLDAWTTMEGKPAGWSCAGRKGSAMTVKPGSGSIITKQKFGDCQVHLEFATPKDDADAGKTGQERGNSGVYIQGRYEVQILDSYKNETYPDGQCGAIYKQHAPLVNASAPPAEWQTYDIIFRAPRFNDKGERTAKARITVLHNAVLIQDNVEVDGPTGSAQMKEEPGDGPIYLQDHGNLVRYRNIWVRPIGESAAASSKAQPK